MEERVEQQIEPAESGRGAATASMVLGIIGLIAWLLPLVGFPVNIVGLVLGLTQGKHKTFSTAKAGVIMSIIGLVLTSINSIAGAVMSVMNTIKAL